MELNICILLVCIRIVDSALEGFVLGGSKATIRDYPHSIFLNIYCKSAFICGGSVLNQNIALTAAHCLEDCQGSRFGEQIILKWGHEKLIYMKSTPIKSYVLHERYEPHGMQNDIALVTVVKPLKLGKSVKRVAITPKAQTYLKTAWTAGWGIVNSKMDVSDVLLGVVQVIQTPQVCRLMGEMPRGTFCAGPIKGTGSPDRGDSGGALMVRDFIQIGLVSYKIKQYSLVVYTNVTYHHTWINRNAVNLRCSSI